MKINQLWQWVPYAFGNDVMTYYDTFDPEYDGTLEVNQVSDSKVDVFFVPSAYHLETAKLPKNGQHKHRAKILELSNEGRVLTVLPIGTFANEENFLKPKYKNIRRITIKKFERNFISLNYVTSDEILEILSGLPSGFVKNYKFGLGFKRDYRFIIDAIESISNCNEICISTKVNTQISSDGTVFCISSRDYDEIRRLINRIRNHAQTAVREVRYSSTYNILAQRIGIDPIEPKIGKHPYRELFTRAAEERRELEGGVADDLIEALSKHAPELAETFPVKLVELRGNIEKVTLNNFIIKYETILKKNNTEGTWQIFFKENPYIFNFAFNYPVVLVGEQLSAGGQKLDRKGTKIPDFMIKNGLTNNVALIEIKTPQAPILAKTPVSDGMYSPSSNLVKAVAQVLDQKQIFESEISHIKNKSRKYDIESYAVRCCVVIGEMPEDFDKKRSLEIYRRNLINVEVITYTEILERLKQLRRFLSCT